MSKFVTRGELASLLLGQQANQQTGFPAANNSQRVLIASSSDNQLNPYHLAQLGAGYNTGTVATSLYTRKKVYLPNGVTNPRLAYTNFYVLGTVSGEVALTGPISPACAIEDSAGNIYPCTFNGNLTGTISNGAGQAPLITDPVPLYVPPVSAGGPGYIWTRTYVNIQLFAYTDLVIDGTTNTKVTSVARPFSSGDVGMVLRVTGGTGFTVASYTISSVTGVTATLSAAVGTLSSTGGVASLAPDISITGVTNSALGDYTTTNTASSDPTAISTGSAVSNYAYWPTYVLGNLPPGTPSVFIEGDSITVPIPGYLFTALTNVISYLHAGASGNSMATMQKKSGSGRMSAVKYATHFYHEMGINDYRGVTSLTAQQYINLATTDVNFAVTQGAKVIMQTLTPFSTNATTALNVWTDAQASQTPQSNDAARRCYNDWVRGVPIASLNTKYGITLTAGTKTPAQLGVTLPCVDVALLLETDNANNPITIGATGQSSGGYYKVAAAAGVTGLAAGAGTTTTSIKGTFTANAYNACIIKFTSGVASGMYATVSATAVGALTLAVALGATPGTNDTYDVWYPYTNDGTHPSTNLTNGDRTLWPLINAALFAF